MKAAIIGTGYVGLVTAVGLAQRGHHVACHDIDPARLKSLATGKAPFFEPDLDKLLQEAVKTGRFMVTPSLPVAMRDADVSIITVGTPSTENGIDLSYILEAAKNIGHVLASIPRYHTVVIKSTVIPGTTDTVVREALEKTSGKIVGKDFGLGMVPEFLREGHAIEDCLHPDRIVVGATDARSRTALTELFSVKGCPTVVTSPRNAEMIKYASNALLATLISFSNEIAGICEAMPGLSEETIMEGLHLDGRFGKNKPAILSYLKGGIGFGGSCFPKDVKALREFAATHKAPHRMLDSVLATNEARPQAVLGLLQQAIGPLRDKRIAVAGLAFKENTSDTRESPGIRVVNALIRAGARVIAHDPMVDGSTIKTDAPIEVAASVQDALRGADACIITTRWPEYTTLNWPQLVKVMANPVVLDGRQVIPLERRFEPMIYVPVGEMPKKAFS